MYYKAFILFIFFLGIAVIIASQFSIPTLFGADGYLHIRMAEFIKLYGLHYNFHWARYSTFARNFADKDFLYHLLIIPVTFLPNMFFGAKIAACLFAVFLYLIFFLLLQRYCHRSLIAVFLIIFLLSVPFLRAISEPRSMVLIMAFTLLFVHFLIKKSKWALFVLAAGYTLAHVSGPYLIFFALLCETTRFINERQFLWKSVLVVMLGVLAGFLMHPHLPNNLPVFYLNGILVPFHTLKWRWGLELGAEFFPIDTRVFVIRYPFILIGLIALIAAATSQVHRIKVSTKIWMSITGFFFVFSFFSERYLIHGYPLILISFAAYFSDWWGSQERLLLLKGNRIAKSLALISVVCIFVLIGVDTYKTFRDYALFETRYNRHYEMAASWMQQNIPPRETIFHSNWSDSQYFIGLNPHNDYFVTFDPIYMYYWNPKKYKLYRDISFGRSSDPYVLLKNEFNVRYGYVGKNYFSGLIAQIRTDPRFEVMAEDNLGLFFRLKPRLY